jgi:uncharacterized membrane protein
MSNENTEIVMAVFAGEDRAEAALKEIEATATSEIGSLHEQMTILSLDADGKLSVKKPAKQQRIGTATGALVGVLVGSALGLPLIGAVLGGVVGRRRTIKKQKSGQDFSLNQVTELMKPDSSMAIAEIEDWRVGIVMSNLEMRGATLVLHASEADLAQAIADAEESSGHDTY